MRRRLLMAATVVVAGLIVYLLSLRQTESGETILEGRVTLDGQPLAGATIDFQGENQSSAPATGKGKDRTTVIRRYTYPSRSDASGRYSVKLLPGLLYTARVRAQPSDKDALPGANGRPPAVEVKGGKQHFDIQLSSR